MLSTNITIAIIIAIIILSIISLNKRNPRNYKNEIVSLGVLGTFVGIAIGLYSFDVTDIKSSMPILLSGLKTAFITSGAGITASIIISLIRPPKPKKSETLDALEIVVKEFNKNLTTQFGDNFKQLNESVKAMITWQNNYKSQITKNEQSLNHIFEQLQKVELIKENEQKRINEMIDNLKSASDNIKASLEETTDIVKEQMQLLLREANRKL